MPPLRRYEHLAEKCFDFHLSMKKTKLYFGIHQQKLHQLVLVSVILLLPMLEVQLELDVAL